MTRVRFNPRKVVIYTHGGLVNEESGLETAQQHIHWWMSNRIYPIYFAWETGLGETISNLLWLARARRGTRYLRLHQ